MTLIPRRFLVTAAALFTAAAPSAAAVAQEEPIKPYDTQAEALLQRAADCLKAAQSFSGVITTTAHYPATDKTPARENRFVRTFRLKKPHSIYQEVVNQKKNPDDGSWQTSSSSEFTYKGKNGPAVFFGDYHVYPKQEIDQNALVQASFLNFAEFFAPQSSDVQIARDGKVSGKLVRLRLLRDEIVDSISCSVVEENWKRDATKNAAATYSITKIYVTKTDGFIRKYHTEIPSPSGSGAVQTFDDVITNVLVDDKRPPSAVTVGRDGDKKPIARLKGI